MKKAKIMLTVIAAIAIVSGALAFKAAKFTSGYYTCDIVGDFPTTTVKKAVLTTTPGHGTTITTTLIYLSSCPGVTYYTGLE